MSTLKQETTLAHPPLVSVKIYVVPWLIPAWARAQAWRNVVLVRKGVELTERLLAHELAHVLQWQSLGIFRFMGRYARYFIKHGYEQNPLEVTARLGEEDDFLLAWAREILTSREEIGAPTGDP